MCTGNVCDVCYSCVCHVHVWGRFVCFCARVSTCVSRPAWSHARALFSYVGGWCLCPLTPYLSFHPETSGSGVSAAGLPGVSCVQAACVFGAGDGMWRSLSWRFSRVGRGSRGNVLGEGVVKAWMTGERLGFSGRCGLCRGHGMCRGHGACDGCSSPGRDPASEGIGTRGSALPGGAAAPRSLRGVG